MTEPSADDPPVERRPSNDRLDSWKEIAAYLKRDITTVRRWEKREGMPVRRHLHGKLGSVYALRSELDAWTRRRSIPFGTDENRSGATTAPRVGPFRTAAIAGAVLLSIAIAWWIRSVGDRASSDRLGDAAFHSITDFGGLEQAAAISRDGRFVAFLSNRDGGTDVWITQVGTGRFRNLTGGRFPELVNPSVRTLGFSPDGSLVTFWSRRDDGAQASAIGIWSVPILGGEAAPYLEGAAEFDWSRDGSRIVYHTPGPGDPMFVGPTRERATARQIFATTAGLHAHFPVWSPDGGFIYFAQGALEGSMDIWRVRPSGGAPERITYHNGRVSHPVLLNDRTLMYLATDREGSGPWMYSVDVDRRMPHRIPSGLDRYSSLAAASDGRRLVATLTRRRGSLYRVALDDARAEARALIPVALTTGAGFSPRFGPGCLLYVSSKEATDVLWKVTDGTATELWTAPDGRIIGGPDVAPDATKIAFSVEQRGKTLLYVMNTDGSDARVVTESLDLRGAPAWARDGRSILSGVNVDGAPQVFRIALDGASAPLVRHYAIDPVWSPDGAYFLYSGADVGTAFRVTAATSSGTTYPVRDLTLRRGARRLRFLGARTVVALRGDIEHKDLWAIDLDTGAERQLTRLPTDFNVRDFDVSPNGSEAVIERVQENSDIVLIDVAPNR